MSTCCNEQQKGIPFKKANKLLWKLRDKKKKQNNFGNGFLVGFSLNDF